MKGWKMLHSAELWRRVILALSLTLTIAAYFHSPLRTLYSLTQVDFADEQKHPRYPAFSDKERTLPLDDFINEKTEGKIREVSSSEWQDVFQRILSGSEALRVRSEDYPPRLPTYFFYPKELPSEYLPKTNDSVWLKYVEGGTTTYWRLMNHSPNYEDFSFGIGLNRQKPPTSFLYPLRSKSLWILFSGVLFYVLIPWPKRQAQDLYIARLRIVLSDFVAMVLFAMFLALPLFVVGGLMATFYNAWGFCAVIWPLAMLGALLIKYVAWYSAFLVRIGTNALFLRTAYSEITIPFGDIASFANAIKVSPRWLVGGLAGSAMANSANKAASLGPALIATGAKSVGYVLNLRDGRRVYIWYSDQRGAPIMTGHERIAEALIAAGVKEESEPMISQAIGLETIEPVSGGPCSNRAVLIENIAIIFGPSLAAIVMGLLL